MSEAESKRIFQSRFNDLLQKEKITQKEIAVICGVSTSTVSTWSKGLNMPRMDKIERLANYFGLPKSYFIEESIPEKEEKPSADEDDLKFALFGGEEEITDEMFEEVKAFAEFVKQKYKKK